MNFLEAFDQQLSNLIDKKYPQAASLSQDKFIKLVTPLKNCLINPNQEFEINIDQGRLSFVIVVTNSVIPSNTTMSLASRDGKPGITKLFPLKPEDFETIPEETIPDQKVYILTNIDRGKDNINLPPNQALSLIRQTNRLPLTIDEGIAVVTHFPEFLQKNNCFSLLASRHSGDQRVPAIWINSTKHPNLGWCWNGNPHTWLGSASAEQRIGFKQ